jgi:hypothetical protein
LVRNPGSSKELVGVVTPSLTRHPKGATMFDCIKRLFGHGYIYAEFVCEDGTVGRSKAPYIGDMETFDVYEYTEQLKNEIWYKYQRRVASVTNVRFS